MSSDLSIDSLNDSFSEFYLAPPLKSSNWNGHQITWRDIPEICSEIEQQILDIYISGNHILAYQLISLYFEQVHPCHEIQSVKSLKSNPHTFNPQRITEFHERRILEQNQILYKAGLVKGKPPPLEPISPTNFPALWAWQTYCLENGTFLSNLKTHPGGFKEFWGEHKKEIIIAAAVIVIAVTVAIIIVTTAGTGTNIAVATGVGAIQAAIDGYDSSDAPHPHVQNGQYEPKVDAGIQNFAGTIGVTAVNNSRTITIIETNSISSEITPEILTDLVTNWNQNLTTSPLEQPDPQPTSFLPWITEGISYSQWKERNYREYLFNEFDNKIKAPTSNNVASGQSALEEISPKVANRLEKIELSQKPRLRFNDRITEDFLKDPARMTNGGTKNNYASQADHFSDGFQSPSPYPKIELIGNTDQSTIHYHCGIGNSVSDIIEGGACLYKTLDKEVAVQPHLIHSSSVGSGLGFVALEQIEKNQAEVRELQQGFILGENDTLRFPKVIVDYSSIRKSIDYEVENLSKIAQNIIEQDNPNLKQVHVTFSNGGYIFNEALKKLPPRYRETIIVVTTGTTAIIDRDLAHKVYNIIGDKDKGSQLCNGGLNRVKTAQEDGKVNLIPQTTAQEWIGGHYFMQPDYQEAISDYLIDEVINKYEIY